MSSTKHATFTWCQQAILEVALELARLDHRLAGISDSLPLPVDVDDLLEVRSASTPVVHLFSAIGTAKEELSELIPRLLKAAQASEESLRQSHRQEPV